MKLSEKGYFSISIFFYSTLIILSSSLPSTSPSPSLSPSAASNTNSFPDVTCAINGNDTCIIRKTADSPLLYDNRSVVWKIKPSNVGFNYYLKTSENGEDLSVRGLLKFKLHLKNWTLSESQPLVDGFRVTIIDHDSNKTIDSYDIEMADTFTELSAHTEIIQVRFQFDNLLKFNNRYAAKIAILPLGVHNVPDTFVINVIDKQDDQRCTSMKSLAERWAPHVVIDVFDPTASLNITWKLAPSFLCIKSYNVVVLDQQERIVNKTEIVAEDGQLFGNVKFTRVPRNQLILVKVRASNSTEGECACNRCSCLTDKTKSFMIPGLADQSTDSPLLFNTTSSGVIEEQSNFNIFLITAILACFILAVLLTICFMTQKYNPILERQILLKTLNRSINPYKGKKNYKILLVCPNAVADENQYMERICQGFRNSNNRVVCDKFDQHSILAEQNMLQWMYHETKTAEKIVVLHSSTRDGGIGVYEILTAFLPANDRRLVHVLLSPKVTLETPIETKYVLPRDENILESAFDMMIPSPQTTPPKEIEEKLAPVCCEIEQEDEEQMCSAKYSEFDEDLKTHTMDSGVSTMSGKSEDSREMLTDTMDSAMGYDLKKPGIEKHPLLNFPIST